MIRTETVEFIAPPAQQEIDRKNQKARLADIESLQTGMRLGAYFDEQFARKTNGEHLGPQHCVGKCRKWLHDGLTEPQARQHIDKILSEVQPGKLPRNPMHYRDPTPGEYRIDR